MLTDAITATHVYPNYVTLYTSLFMWPKLVTNSASTSPVDEGEPLTEMTHAYEAKRSWKLVYSLNRNVKLPFTDLSILKLLTDIQVSRTNQSPVTSNSAIPPH